jgi:leucyl-tRNA synthetase
MDRVFFIFLLYNFDYKVKYIIPIINMDTQEKPANEEVYNGYNHIDIETKWREKWFSEKLFQTPDRKEGQNKFYSLYSFPYPSGAGLHVGHAEGMFANDIIARYYRMNNAAVTLPMGWDSFGLPAENYAIKTGIHPQDSTEEAIATFIDQIKRLGISVDWDKEVGAHRKDYYKWTQWFFTQLYKYGLAYKGKASVNWCPKDQTVLANEQVIDGKCERCDSEIVQKEMEQWFFRITDYADRLVEDLDGVDWPEPTKIQQRNWIGRSEGASVKFAIQNSKGEKLDDLEVFTTAHDTIYGVTFMVISPEHKFIQDRKAEISNLNEINEYIIVTKSKTEIERTDLNKEKTGIEIKGIKAINPVNNKEIPVFIADYVLVNYGTGAIMAVPGHDERDFAFAKKHSLPVIYLTNEAEFVSYSNDIKLSPEKFTLKNSDEFDGLNFIEARNNILKKLTNQEAGNAKVSYRIRDWLISRQRYWGAPIPVIWKERRAADKVVLINDSKMNTALSKLKVLLENAVEIADSKMIGEQKLTAESSLVVVGTLTNDALKYVGKNKIKQLILVSPFSTNEIDIKSVSENVQEIVIVFDMNTSKEEFRNEFENKFNNFKNVEFKYFFKDIELNEYFGEKQYKVLEESDLPLELPMDVDFIPKGYSPLSRSEKYIEYVQDKFGKEWTPEFDTMDTFVCSSWYFFRFIDPRNEKIFAKQDELNKWLPADLYMIGAEHIVLHLLYARFFTKFLFDRGLINFKEPFAKMRHMGIILGPDGRKMSKRWGNVINPNDVVKEYGSDTLRMYEMFMGPLDQSKAWNDSSVQGVRRVLERIYNFNEKAEFKASSDTEVIINKLIKKVGEDIVNLKYNTAVSEFMKAMNIIEEKGIDEINWKKFILVLAPFAPYIAEEMWNKLGEKYSIHTAKWPEYDMTIIEKEKIKLAVQFKGKTRGDVSIDLNMEEKDITQLVKSDERLNKYLEQGYNKVIYIKGRIINYV